MKFKTKYKVMLLKKYFDMGFGTLGYVKYLVAAVGVKTLIDDDYQTLLILGFIYAITCFVFGYFYVKFKWFTAEQEVSNRFNMFVKEMRDWKENGKVFK